MTGKVLVSACLLGDRVRYDGRVLPVDPVIARWQARGMVVACCPEVAGGLSVPRPPAEIVAPGCVRCRDGSDVSAAFARGAEAALALCRAHGITVAVLKEGSPSCGSSCVGDGSFSGAKVAGEGMTAALLRRYGVRVFSEKRLQAAARALA